MTTPQSPPSPPPPDAGRPAESAPYGYAAPPPGYPPPGYAPPGYGGYQQPMPPVPGAARYAQP